MGLNLFLFSKSTLLLCAKGFAVAKRGMGLDGAVDGTQLRTMQRSTHALFIATKGEGSKK